MAAVVAAASGEAQMRFLARIIDPLGGVFPDDMRYSSFLMNGKGLPLRNPNATGYPSHQPEANEFLTRDYRPGWEL